jgi:hypothetical protein
MNGSGQQHQDACLDEDENLHDGQVGVTERFAGVPHLGKPMIVITAYETPRAKSTRADPHADPTIRPAASQGQRPLVTLG